MSTATADPPRPPDTRRVDPVIVQPVTQARVIRSEWIKFSTLRSTWITLVLSMIGTIGIGALASWGTNNRWSHMDPGEHGELQRGQPQPVRRQPRPARRRSCSAY